MEKTFMVMTAFPATQEQQAVAQAWARGPRLRGPFDVFEGIEREFARAYDQVPVALRRSVVPTQARYPAGAPWAPRLDAYEKDGWIEIVVDLPGFKREDLNITIEDAELVISGDRQPSQEISETDYYRMERRNGQFYRRLALPFEIVAQPVEALYADGVLTIRVPKPAEPVPQVTRIAVH
jgi:HSP20 family protein